MFDKKNRLNRPSSGDTLVPIDENEDLSDTNMRKRHSIESVSSNASSFFQAQPFAGSQTLAAAGGTTGVGGGYTGGSVAGGVGGVGGRNPPGTPPRAFMFDMEPQSNTSSGGDDNREGNTLVTLKEADEADEIQIGQRGRRGQTVQNVPTQQNVTI